MNVLQRTDVRFVVRSLVICSVLGTVFLWTFLVMVESVHAETITIPVTEDAYIDQGDPDANFGSRAYMIVRGDDTFSCALVKFADFAIHDMAILDRAEFSFNVFYHSGAANMQVRVAPTARAWSADTATWSRPPGQHMDARFTSFPIISTTNGTKTIDLTTMTEAWLDGELDNNGFYICNPPDDNAATIHITSSDVERGQLRVTYHFAEDEEDMDPAEGVGDDGEPAPVDLFDLRSPDDGDELDDTTPKFKWSDVDEGYDIAGLVLTVNRIVDDGDDVEEVIREELDTDDTKYTTEEELEEGNYRWYMEAYWDTVPVYRTESRAFEIKLADEDEDDVADVASVVPSGSASTGDSSSDDVTAPSVPAVPVVQEEQKEEEEEEEENDSITVSKKSMFNTLWGLIALILVAGAVWWFLWKKKQRNGADKNSTKKTGEEKKKKQE